MGVGCAVGVLRDAHAPYEAGAAERGLCVDAGRLRDVVGGHARDLLDVLQIVLVDSLTPLIEALGAVLYEIKVGQPFVENDLGHAVEQRYVGAGTRPHPDLREVAHLDAARVDDDELGALLHDGAAHARGCHRVVGVGVGADDDQASGLLVVLVGVAGCAAAQGCQHRLNRRRVTQARAVVDVVALHYQPRELLLDVAVLVGGLGRAQRPKGVASVLRQLFGNQLQRLVPGGWCKLAVFAD